MNIKTKETKMVLVNKNSPINVSLVEIQKPQSYILKPVAENKHLKVTLLLGIGIRFHQLI